MAELQAHLQKELEAADLELDRLYGRKFEVGAHNDVWEDRHGEPNEADMAELDEINTAIDALNHRVNEIEEKLNDLRDAS